MALSTLSQDTNPFRRAMTTVVNRTKAVSPVGGNTSLPTALKPATNTTARPLAETPDQAPVLRDATAPTQGTMDATAAAKKAAMDAAMQQRSNRIDQVQATQPAPQLQPKATSEQEAILRDRSQTGAPVDLRNTGSVVEQALGNPSGFNTEVFQQSLNRAFGDIDAQGRDATSRLEADAARRGVFFGSPLTTSKGDLASELQRAKTGAATDLLLRQAETLGADRARAINQAMQFGSNANAANIAKSQAGQALLQQGSATPNAQVIASMLQQSPELSPEIFALLGQLFGGG